MSFQWVYPAVASRASAVSYVSRRISFSTPLQPSLFVPRISSYALLDLDKDEELTTPKQVLAGSRTPVTLHNKPALPGCNITLHPLLKVLLSPGSPDLGFTVGQFSSQGQRYAAHPPPSRSATPSHPNATQPIPPQYNTTRTSPPRRVHMEDRVLVRDLSGVPPFDRQRGEGGGGGAYRALLLGVFDGHAGELGSETNRQ